MSEGSGGAAQRQADSRHLMRAGLFVSAALLLSKSLGMLRDSVAAAIFGANRTADTFFVARTIPDAVSTWIEAPVRSAFVPLFTRTLHEQGEEQAWRIASNVINCLALFLGLIVLLLFVAARPIVTALSPGFKDDAAWNSGAGQARIVIVSILFSVLAQILGCLLNIYRRQGLTSLANIVNGALVLGGVAWLGRRIGLSGYAWGILAGAVGSCLLQLWVVFQHRKQYRLVVAPRAPEMRQLMALALPLFIGLTGTRIDVFIDRAFISYLNEGDLTVLVLALAITNVAADLVLTAAQAVLLPHFAHLVAQKRFEELRLRLAQAIDGYLLLMLPMAAFLTAGAGSVVALLYARGAFSPENAKLAAILIPICGLMGPAHGVGQIIAQTYVAAGDTRTPMFVGFWRLGFDLILTICLLPFIGVLGVALASSLSAYYRVFLLWRRMPVEIRPDGERLRRETLKLLIATAVGMLVTYIAVRFVPSGTGLVPRAVSCLTLGLACLGVTLLSALSIGAETARDLVRKLARR